MLWVDELDKPYELGRELVLGNFNVHRNLGAAIKLKMLNDVVDLLEATY